MSNFQILLSNRPSSMCPSRFKLNYQKRFRIFTFLKYDSGSLLLKAVNQQFIVASIKKMTTFVQLLWDLVNKLLNKKNYTKVVIFLLHVTIYVNSLLLKAKISYRILRKWLSEFRIQVKVEAFLSGSTWTQYVANKLTCILIPDFHFCKIGLHICAFKSSKPLIYCCLHYENDSFFYNF